MSIADILDKAADKLSAPGAWTQDALARDESGEDVPVEFGVSFCADGAIYAVGGSFKAKDFFGRLVSPQFGWASGWNDAPERTQPEVVAKLREAAAKAREQGL